MIKTLGAIESFTGGLFSSCIVSQAGASKYFRGAIIAYATDLKSKLGIKTNNGVINKSTALEMAKYGQKFLNVDICVSFTGNAGPTNTENEPIGKVFIAINNECHELQLTGTRNQIRQLAVDFAIEKLKQFY